MDFPTLILWGVALIMAPVVLFVVIRVSFKKQPYQFKMIFMTPGIDDHVTEYGDKLDLTVDVNDKEYEIKAERLYRLKPKVHQRLWNKGRGIKQSFITVYQHEKTEPLAPVTVKVSSRILKEVSESRALDKALRSEFKVPWNLKTILMVIGFLVVAVVIYFVISGDVAI